MYATRVNVDRWEENCEEKILKLREKRKEEKKNEEMGKLCNSMLQ